jgi:hypothetical protein
VQLSVREASGLASDVFDHQRDIAAYSVAPMSKLRYVATALGLGGGRPFDPTGERPRLFTDSTWGFQLEELPGGRTRLVVSGYWSLRPRWLRPLMSAVEPAHWVMQTRQFANLKRPAERDAADADQPVVRPPMATADLGR